MSQANKISAVISDEDKQNVQNNIKSIQTMLASVLMHSLTADDRHTMVKMGDKSVAFVQKALDYASKNPTLVPSYLDATEAEKDFKLYADLQSIYNQLGTLFTSVEDALMICGSEAMNGALIFYQSLQGAVRSNVPGSEAILEDLKQRFPKKSSKAGTKKTVDSQQQVSRA